MARFLFVQRVAIFVVCVAMRLVEALKSNLAPCGSARVMSPDRVWTSIFGKFLPGFRSISPRSRVKSSDCVKSES